MLELVVHCYSIGETCSRIDSSIIESFMTPNSDANEKRIQALVASVGLVWLIQKLQVSIESTSGTVVTYSEDSNIDRTDW